MSSTPPLSLYLFWIKNGCLLHVKGSGRRNKLDQYDVCLSRGSEGYETVQREPCVSRCSVTLVRKEGKVEPKSSQRVGS